MKNISLLLSIALIPALFSSNARAAVAAVDGGIPVLNGNAGFGLGLQALFPVTDAPGLSLGAETGYLHWSVAGISENSIPLSATGKYIFREQPLQDANFFASASLGLSFTSVSNDSISGNSTDFVFLVGPGLEFAGTHGHLLWVDFRFGTYAANFIFEPRVGINFPLE